MPNTSTTFLLLTLTLNLLTGCASYGRISNQPYAFVDTAPRYSIQQAGKSQRPSDVTLVLAFSGGGTRAAALSYGVLKALRDTTITIDGQPRRLLDEVDLISSVSGGSFTAAYFGLHGDGVFRDFEEKFLRRDVSGELINGLLSPMLWFSKRGRTEMAITYYEKSLFNGATFGDLLKRDGPLIVINATDLGKGVRFSFLQDYFDLLCSDLSSFPVARAVTASSAVPVLFNPVVVENFPGCLPYAQTSFTRAQQKRSGSPKLAYLLDGLNSYSHKEQRKYIHLVDGGITDNLGLLAIYEMVEIAGGAKALMSYIGSKPAPRFVIISVNASTTPQYSLEASNMIPPLETVVNSVTDIQLHRSNVATSELLQTSIDTWVAEFAGESPPIEPYFVEVDFNSVAQPDRRFLFNQMPTSFSLKEEQLDDLIDVGKELLESNPEFRRFLDDFGAPSSGQTPELVPFPRSSPP